MEAPFKVTGIDHVVFHVKDLLGAKKFYTEFLGMTIDHESSWQCFLKCGNQGIALFKVDDSEDVHGAAKSITWRYAWRPAITRMLRQRLKTPASKFTGARAIHAASTSTTPMAISYNS